MNIDKQAMAIALAHRTEPKYEKEFYGYLKQMATYFANFYNISREYREDYISDSYICALKAIDKYDPVKNKSPFSYFYKAYKIHFLYWMRYDAGKRSRSYKTCSYDLLENTIDGEKRDDFTGSILDGDGYCEDDALLETSMENCAEEIERDEDRKRAEEKKRVIVEDKVYSRNDMVAAVKEAKLLAKRKVDINSVEDEMVKLALTYIYNHKNNKKEKKVKEDLNKYEPEAD
jgi:hypothetical protein